MEKKHIHCIGIGGIGISALARYYLGLGYRITGTNTGSSQLIETLKSEGIEIVENGAQAIDRETEKVIYTEAIIDDHALGLAGVRDVHMAEIQTAQSYNIPTLSYPEALAEVFHTFPMKIAVAGAHGKSTTSAMIGTILHDLHASATTVTGTLLKSFGGKNVESTGQDIINIEACEYRNAFLNYHPDIAVITNIDPDHLDFFKTEEAYAQAFERFIAQSKCVVMLADEYGKIKEKYSKYSPLGGDKGVDKNREVKKRYEADIQEGPSWGQKSLFPYWKLPQNSSLQEYAKSLRSAGIHSEVRFWQVAKSIKEQFGFDLDRQKIIGDYIVDFFLPELGLVFEIDGSTHDEKEVYDTKRDIFLKNLGLEVHHISGYEVMQNTSGVFDHVVSVCQEREKWLFDASTPLSPQEGKTTQDASPEIFSQKIGQATHTFVIVYPNHFEVIGQSFNGIETGKYSYELPALLVPGDHIQLDASLAYVVSQLLHLDPESSKQSLVKYPGSWRRMEIIGVTKNSNLLMSDYGHHPTEIRATLSALKKAYPEKKLIVFFEPHQFSRTYELRGEFAKSFVDADETYISDIYAARDIDERRDLINSRTLAEMVSKYSVCYYAGTLAGAGKKLQEIDSNEKNSLLLLLGAGNIDELRNVINQ